MISVNRANKSTVQSNAVCIPFERSVYWGSSLVSFFETSRAASSREFGQLYEDLGMLWTFNHSSRASTRPGMWAAGRVRLTSVRSSLSIAMTTACIILVSCPSLLSGHFSGNSIALVLTAPAILSTSSRFILVTMCLCMLYLSERWRARVLMIAPVPVMAAMETKQIAQLVTSTVAPKIQVIVFMLRDSLRIRGNKKILRYLQCRWLGQMIQTHERVCSVLL